MFDIDYRTDYPTFFIQVKDGRWDAFGMPTRINHLRTKMVMKIGVNKSVQEGYYYPVIERVRWTLTLRLKQFIIV